MSTDYIVKGDPIRIGEIVQLPMKIEGLDFQIEDPNNRNTFLDDGKIPIGEHYRFRISYKGNYLWGHINGGETDHFVRYGMNDVSKIISIIQHHTERCLVDEYTYYETSDVFGDLEKGSYGSYR